MAQVDSRLQPLFAALNEAGFDWLVSEIIDLIDEGRPSLATEHDLASARAKVSLQSETPGEIAIESEDIETFLGDEQVRLAADLLEARFESLAQMLKESEDSLGTIARRRKSLLAVPAPAFLVSDEVRTISPQMIIQLSNDIGNLIDALQSWVSSVASTDGGEQ